MLRAAVVVTRAPIWKVTLATVTVAWALAVPPAPVQETV
jgi:hypothetical protein